MNNLSGKTTLLTKQSEFFLSAMGIFRLCFLFLFFVNAVDAEQIRESTLAGAWYPDDAVRLRREVTGYLNNVSVVTKADRLVALICPHAGYRYSGQVAAHAYKLLENRNFDTVVVVAPSHHHRFNGISVYDRGGYRTPLGLVSLDNALIEAIKRKDPLIRYVAAAHAREHSVEIQLPFLQTVLPEFKLVPLVMGEQSPAACRRLADTLSTCLRDRSVLLVASTDLSHFHSDDEAKKLDDRIMARVKNMDAAGLLEDLSNGEGEACGGGPMVAVMLAASHLGAGTAQILNAANSGDVTGDRRSVVGYMAAALWSPARKKTGAGGEFSLTTEEKASLHRIAENAIEAVLNDRAYHIMEPLTASLKAHCGAFVTLKKKGALRGCIGHIVGRMPLAETVARMAVAAAFEDPRFGSITRAEWPSIALEISVMSPLKQISDVSALETGRHGVYIKNRFRSGLLLPQVATEYGWDRITFLEQTCRKAGLDKDAWKSPNTDIFIFSADVF